MTNSTPLPDGIDDTAEAAPVYSRRADVLWRSTSAGPVVLAPDWDTPEHLQGAAALVWEVLDRPLDGRQVEREVTDLVPDIGDVDTALDELVERRLVEERR